MDFHGADPCRGDSDTASQDAPGRAPRSRDPAGLAGLIAHLPGAVYRCEAKAPWRVLYVSDQIEALTGCPARDFTSGRLRWADIVHPDDRAACERWRTAELAATGRCQLDYRIVHRDGDVRWLVEHGAAVRQADGRNLLEGYLFDNSRQKLAEAALRAGEAQLSTLFKQALVGILHRDRAGNVISVNDALCRMLGRTAEQLNGLPLAALLHPDDAAEHARAFEAHAAAGTPYAAERRYVRPDGSVIWCEIQVSFVRDERGEVESAIALLLDITARHEVDEQRDRAITMLHMAVQGADAGLFELDLEDYSLWLTPEALRIYGLPESHGPHLSHAEWRTLLHPGDLDIPPPIASEKDCGSKPVALEFRVCDPDGGIRWLRSLSHAIPSAKGNLTRLAGLVFDDTERKLAEQKLLAGEEHMQLVQRAARIGTYQTDANMVSVCSKQFYRNLGLDENMPQLTEAEYAARIHPDDREKAAREGRAAMASNAESIENEFRIVRADDGEVRWMFNRTRYLRDAEGRMIGAVGAHMDVTDRKRAEEAARAGAALNLSITEASADCIALLDPEGRLTFLNGHGLVAAGAEDFAALADKPWASCWPAAAGEGLAQAIMEAREGGVGRFTGCTRAQGGAETWWDVAITPVRGETDQPGALLAISRDVTEQRRTVERVRWAAGHDAMTGLPNRRFFHEQLQETLQEAKENGDRVGLLVLDIDHFKEVNDDRGHDAGDALLRVFAERLRLAVRSTDTVARLGGDEFAVILRHLGSEADMALIVPPILERLQVPFSHFGRALDCRASVGAAIFPDQGETPDELMKNADLALYAAKLSHRGSVTMFSADMRAEMQNRISMLNLARDAIREGLIEPYYQPKTDLRTGRLTGFEALLRWRHPSLGVQPPATIAEAFGDVELASQIGARMQEKVFADMRRWLGQGLDFHHVAINTSAAEFRKDDYAEQLLARLKRAKVPPELLEVEITERTAFLGKNSEYVVRALEVLRAHRVRVALDDFGTGFSSLSHLKELPVDVLKIDQSFVRDIAGTPDPDDSAIVLAVLNLGRSLNIEVVAEGIEQESQAAFLRANGCDTGQGYLFGRAIPAAQVPALMKAAESGAEWQPAA
ncbi:MAG: EAL domain-containing protein [Sphingomonadaceae bacterium]|nr:EAL domain-containing protein [Sphingomonadaceae bacterium]